MAADLGRHASAGNLPEITSYRQAICQFTGIPSLPMSAIEELTQTAALYGRAGAGAVAETLWPTRCAICDAPGIALCEECRARLPYIDWWRACPRCGAPFGRVQCCECNDLMLSELGLEALPFDGLVSAVAFTDESAAIVRTWKDAGERRLSAIMAGLMAPQIPPAWLKTRPTVTCIPATFAARQRRGFDHGHDLANDLAQLAGLRCADLLARPRTADQRNLGRAGRARNLHGAFRTVPNVACPPHVLLVDDVCTTGATICAATLALKAAGARTVHCCTFARV